MQLRRVKRDQLGRRTDKVKPRERRTMERLTLRENLSDSEIGGRLGRDPRTVRKQLELAEQERENSARTTTPDSARVHQLIQKWRIEVESYSPIQLLQRWLNEASADALGHFFTDKDTKMVYLEAWRPHFETFDLKRLYLQVESDPAFRSLRLKYPTSAIWATLEAWGEQAVPYLRALSDILCDLKAVMNYAFGEEGIDDSAYPVFFMRHKMETFCAILMICDFLTRGIAELPENVRWGLLVYDLEKLRARVNLELSSLTKRTRKGGWPSTNLIEQVWADPQDRSGLAQEIRRFLTELVKLHAIQDRLAIALQELESKI